MSKLLTIGCILIAGSIISTTEASARFLQTDPVGYEDQMNLYAYVGNDPFNFSDPSGMNGQRAYQWALSQVGSRDYQSMDSHDMVLGRAGDWAGGRFAPKCNCFVGDALVAGGDPVLSVNGEDRYAVTADWGNPASIIEGYRPLEAGEWLMPGDILSDGHHVGIYAPMITEGPETTNLVGGTVSQPSLTRWGMRDRVTHNDWGVRASQEGSITSWRCACDDPPELVFHTFNNFNTVPSIVPLPPGF